TNLPNKKKRDAGRIPCPTKSINFNDASYSLDVFPLSEDAADSKPEPTRAAVDVDTLPVSDRIKDLIRFGDREKKYKSRSEAVIAVLVAMASAGCTNDQMTDVMFDKALPIGEHVREHAKSFNYLKRQIERARAVASPGQRAEVKIKAKLEDVLKNAADLQHKTFEELRHIIPRYLPEGCTLLAGRPKIGKSWLGLDAGIAVSSGGMCMGQQCEQ